MNFGDMVSKSYAYKAERYTNSIHWYILKTLYERNFVNNPPTEVLAHNIPHIIHQIWLGGNIPEQYKKYAETWKKHHPGWQYKLWTDDDVKNIFLSKEDLFHSATNLGMKSDILRYEILKQYGGIYIDTDFECLRPLDPLMHFNFFTGVGYDTEPQLYNGLIATIPNHPIITRTLELCGPIYTGNKGSVILNTTGANIFTKAFFQSLGSKGIVAFPTPYFYPYPNNIRGKGNPLEHIYDVSYAIHHWAVSWVKNKK